MVRMSGMPASASAAVAPGEDELAHGPDHRFVPPAARRWLGTLFRDRPPALVVLCDISGSMSRYSQMFLQFLHAAVNERAHCHVLLFGTRLTNVTRQLRARDIDLALKKVKKMVGGGTMSIINQTIPRALRRLGYNQEQIEAIEAFVDENNTVVGAPALKPEHDLREQLVRALGEAGDAEPAGHHELLQPRGEGLHHPARRLLGHVHVARDADDAHQVPPPTCRRLT